jgi:hypothetical protein
MRVNSGESHSYSWKALKQHDFQLWGGLALASEMPSPTGLLGQNVSSVRDGVVDSASSLSLNAIRRYQNRLRGGISDSKHHLSSSSWKKGRGAEQAEKIRATVIPPVQISGVWRPAQCLRALAAELHATRAAFRACLSVA